MKQKLLYILLMITALLGGNAEAWAWGENTSYVCNVPDEYKHEADNGTGRLYELTGPGATLTYEACKSWSSLNGLYIETSADQSNWITSEMQSVGENSIGGTKKWKSNSYTITDTNVRYIRFRTKASSYNKWYRNVKVTRATTLATSTSSIDFGSIAVNTSFTKQASISFNNTTYP